MTRWIHQYWPSFAAAIAGEVVFFAVIDPQQLYLLGEPVAWSPIAVYSVGFFLFWGLTAFTTLLTQFFGRSAAELNQPH